MYRNPTVPHTCQRSQSTGIASGNHIFVFVPEIKDIPKQEKAGRIRAKAVQESGKACFPARRVSVPEAQMNIGNKIIFAHNKGTIRQESPANRQYTANQVNLTLRTIEIISRQASSPEIKAAVKPMAREINGMPVPAWANPRI